MANDSRDRVVQKQTQECDSFSHACGKLINQLRAVYMPSEAKRNKRKASGGSKALFSVFGAFSFYMLWACHWMLLSGGRAQPVDAFQDVFLGATILLVFFCVLHICIVGTMFYYVEYIGRVRSYLYGVLVTYVTVSLSSLNQIAFYAKGVV